MLDPLDLTPITDRVTERGFCHLIESIKGSDFFSHCCHALQKKDAYPIIKANVAESFSFPLWRPEGLRYIFSF